MTIRGFMLLPPSPIPEYQGVFRWPRVPFDPVVIGEEIEASAVRFVGDRVWKLYPPGWRRDAYRIFEENLAPGCGDDSSMFSELFLISEYSVARRIRSIIEPHLGPHEIVICDVATLESPRVESTDPAQFVFLGFDAAYPGGDLYSAIANGLFINPDPALMAAYQHLLNQFGLFVTADVAREYTGRFQCAVLSETTAEFCIYRLARERPSIATG